MSRLAQRSCHLLVCQSDEGAPRSPPPTPPLLAALPYLAPPPRHSVPDGQGLGWWGAAGAAAALGASQAADLLDE